MKAAQVRPGARESMADSILDVSQRLIQTRGYNGFSYRDIAQDLGIKAASIHYHFPTKSDLGVRLAVRYRERFRAELVAIAAAVDDPEEQLIRFGDLFRRTFEVGSRLCLCGMLSAEIATLPEPVAAEVESFFRETQHWLSGVLDAGRDLGRFRFAGPAEQQARFLLAILEGAMVVARGLRDAAHFQVMVQSYLGQLRTAG
jgi:TetR/AcrR family transcriptional regulator, transcriptional repressor for nem operon